jgi:hypothetical protein
VSCLILVGLPHLQNLAWGFTPTKRSLAYNISYLCRLIMIK